MEENKGFLIPSSSITSTLTPVSPEMALGNFGSTSQIYPNRKMKHPSFRKRAISNSMPYYIPLRQRTKSENNDLTTPATEGMDVENIHDKSNLNMEMDGPLQQHLFNKVQLPLKKAKSMESLLGKSEENNDTKISSSTLEFVSFRIQKLKFNE